MITWTTGHDPASGVGEQRTEAGNTFVHSLFSSSLTLGRHGPMSQLNDELIECLFGA